MAPRALCGLGSLLEINSLLALEIDNQGTTPRHLMVLFNGT